MGNNKETTKGHPEKTSMGNKSDGGYDGKGANGSEKDAKKSSSNPTSPTPMTDDDEMNTAGGRKGNFSDQDRMDQPQWSPGKGESHS